MLDDTNHVLKAVATDDREANLAPMATPTCLWPPGVVSAVTAFIRGVDDQ